MGSIMKIDKLTFRYTDRFIFDRFCLDIEESSWISICGSNGSGKSTLIKLITGLLKCDSSINVCDLELNEKNLYDIRKNIGVVFSNPDNLFVCETVEDDLAFSLENLCYTVEEMRKRINKIAKKLNISHLLNKSPNELSGGEKAKVALACALVHKPKILILDESLSMIDEFDKKNVLDLLKELHKNGLTIISVVHDLRETYYSDRLIIINNGEIMLDGHPLKVMEYDKILNRLGIEIPFEIDLSIKLKLYGLIDTLIPDIGKLVDTLWQ